MQMQHNAITRVCRNTKHQTMEQAELAAIQGVIDACAALMFVALHDKFGFGKKRCKQMVIDFDDLENRPSGFIREWQQAISKKGFNNEENSRLAEMMRKWVLGCKPYRNDRRIIRNTQDYAAGVFIVMYRYVSEKFGFGESRLRKLQKHVHDNVYALCKEPGCDIWGFMTIANRYCDIEFEELIQWEKAHGPYELYE